MYNTENKVTLIHTFSNINDYSLKTKAHVYHAFHYTFINKRE